MKNNNINEDPYKSISETATELGLINKKNGHIQTHTLRYWETQFKQIKPIIGAGKRRYYSKKVINIVKYIQFLLKDKGLTVAGVKKILDKKGSITIDANTNFGVYKSELNNTNTIKNKVKKISKIIKEIKKINNG